VRDDETGAVATQRCRCLLDQQLGSGIHRAGCFVQDQDRWLCKERTRDRDELLFPGTDPGSLFTDHRVVAIRKGVHETVHISSASRGPDIVLAGIRVAVGDVLPNAPVEQPGVLEHHPDP